MASMVAAFVRGLCHSCFLIMTSTLRLHVPCDFSGKFYVVFAETVADYFRKQSKRCAVRSLNNNECDLIVMAGSGASRRGRGRSPPTRPR